jgi:peptidoglycan/xylan/chitin deacetylase (PgdA/CDA1 family)
MEIALRDWLFGCNPWGTSMIVGYPAGGDYPEDPHTALTHLYGYQVDGGLVDGPVYATIFNNLLGLVIHHGDEYEDYQMSMVYHDDYGDYSTNEPTMDGTASLSYYLSALEKEAMELRNYKKLEYDHGGIIRTDRSKKEINLVFTGGDFADGYETINKVLDKHSIKASFFFTGDFYRKPEFKSLITALKNDGHYLGAHSDQHLQYAAWEKRDSTLVTESEFKTDILANYVEIKKFGVSPADAPYFLPPYEWYNEKISNWTKQLGLTLVNYTPGTLSAADWTVPELGKSYRASEEILQSILTYEENEADGLNGFVLLLHIGAHPDRTDKFYQKFEELIDSLIERGYRFTLLDETIR